MENRFFTTGREGHKGIDIMVNSNPGCFGHYDFNHIAYFAKKRFVDGCDTISMLMQAQSETEREEIALACMLDVDDEVVLDIQLDCRYADNCKVTNCRDKLRKSIEAERRAQEV